MDEMTVNVKNKLIVILQILSFSTQLDVSTIADDHALLIPLYSTLMKAGQEEMLSCFNLIHTKDLLLFTVVKTYFATISLNTLLMEHHQ